MKSILSLSMTLLVLSLTACGDNNSDDSTPDTPQTQESGATASTDSSMPVTENTSDIALIPEFSCENIHTYPTGEIMTSKLGANGMFSCEETSYGAPKLVFTNDIPTLDITQLTMSQEISTHDNIVAIEGTISTNLKDGIQTFKLTSSKDGSINCTRTYDVNNLPFTLYEASELNNYLYLEDNYQLLSDNCPSWIDEDTEDDINFRINSLIQISVTDVSGTTSNIIDFFEIK